MPVRIGELTSDVFVEPEAEGGDRTAAEPEGDWAQLDRQRRLEERRVTLALRTHARGLDD